MDGKLLKKYEFGINQATPFIVSSTMNGSGNDVKLPIQKVCQISLFFVSFIYLVVFVL